MEDLHVQARESFNNMPSSRRDISRRRISPISFIEFIVSFEAQRDVILMTCIYAAYYLMPSIIRIDAGDH